MGTDLLQIFGQCRIVQRFLTATIGAFALKFPDVEMFRELMTFTLVVLLDRHDITSFHPYAKKGKKLHENVQLFEKIMMLFLAL